MLLYIWQKTFCVKDEQDCVYVWDICAISLQIENFITKIICYIFQNYNQGHVFLCRGKTPFANRLYSKSFFYSIFKNFRYIFPESKMFPKLVIRFPDWPINLMS